MSLNDERQSRRDFLGKAGLMAAITAAPASGAEGETEMPKIKLGKFSFSRLVCGNNPFNGGSHTSPFLNEEMRRYYTPEQTYKTLRRCQDLGINCWQSGSNKLDVYRRLVEEGRPMHFLATGHSGPGGTETLKRGGCVGLAMSGEPTDVLFKTGKIDQLKDYLTEVRDSGMLVGVSTHMPAVVDVVESKGWDVDYYMTCLFKYGRTHAEWEKLFEFNPGLAPLEIGHPTEGGSDVYGGEVAFVRGDPPEMLKVVKQTKKPCWVYKLLACGRLAQRQDIVEGVFKDIFANIKSTDAVVVGMYDKHLDQYAINKEYVVKYGGASIQHGGTSPSAM
jgi:hypothetical protein